MAGEPAAIAPTPDGLLGLARACRTVAELRDAAITPNVARRWCLSGLRRRGTRERVVLHHERIGGRLFVTERAVREFLADVNGAKSASTPSRETWLEQKLIAAGL